MKIVLLCFLFLGILNANNEFKMFGITLGKPINTAYMYKYLEDISDYKNRNFLLKNVPEPLHNANGFFYVGVTDEHFNVKSIKAVSASMDKLSECNKLFQYYKIYYSYKYDVNESLTLMFNNLHNSINDIVIFETDFFGLSFSITNKQYKSKCRVEISALGNTKYLN